MILLNFGQSLEAKHERIMFNACDVCRPWTASKTAHFMISIDAANRNHEFSQEGEVVMLGPPNSGGVRNYKYYAIFFGDSKSCLFFSSSLHAKCYLAITCVND